MDLGTKGSQSGLVSGVSAPVKLTGQVVGFTGDKQPVLRSALGTLTLDIRAAIPLGSSIAIELSLESLGKGGMSAAEGRPAASTTAGNPQMTVAEPVVALGNLQLPAPEIGPRLAPGLLLFLAAIKGGRISQWLTGADGRLPRTAGGAASERLGAEAAGLVRTIENSGGEWRLFLLPFLHDSLRDNLRLYLRANGDPPGQEGRHNAKKARRFIVEADLSALGAVQLDGFVAPERFDLIFRCEKPLPSELRRGISEIFANTLKAEDWRGRISFARLGAELLGETNAKPSDRRALTA